MDSAVANGRVGAADGRRARAALLGGVAGLASTMGYDFLARHYRLRALLERKRAEREEARHAGRFSFCSSLTLRAGRVVCSPAPGSRGGAVVATMRLNS